MIHLKFDKKTYYIPMDFSELKLAKFQELITYRDSVEKFTDLTTQEEVDINVTTLHIISGIPKDELYQIPIEKLGEILSHLNFLSDYPKTIIKSFKIGKWHKRRNFILVNDIKKMTTREYLDFDYLIKDGNTVIANLHKIVAVLYREKGTIYKTENLDKLSSDIAENITCDIALPALSFILTLGRN